VYLKYQTVFKMYTHGLLRIYIYDILNMYYSWLVDWYISGRLKLYYRYFHYIYIQEMADQQFVLTLLALLHQISTKIINVKITEYGNLKWYIYNYLYTIPKMLNTNTNLRSWVWPPCCAHFVHVWLSTTCLAQSSVSWKFAFGHSAVATFWTPVL
jgi:hypothetical protein